MEMKIGYKIFSLVGGHLGSLTISENKKGFKIYPRGDCITVPSPGCGPLTVFGSLQTARDFKNDNGWTYNPIFSVVYEEAKGENVIFTPSMRKAYLPEGTVLAKSVKILQYIGI